MDGSSQHQTQGRLSHTAIDLNYSLKLSLVRILVTKSQTVPRLTRVDKHWEKLPDTLASESVEDDKCFPEQSKIEVLD